jgi:hypothetical protein
VDSTTNSLSNQDTRMPIDIMVSRERFIGLDQSVLENHHVAATFDLIQKDEYNIFNLFSREEYK